MDKLKPFVPIPVVRPTYEQIAKQMRINVDILMKEISEHVDKEIERLSRKIKEIEHEKH